MTMQPPRAVPTSGMATASLVFGLIGFFGGWCAFGLPCLIAIVCGHFAWKETKNGSKAGHGQAVTGLILGYVIAVPAALTTVLIFSSVLGLGTSMIEGYQ